MSIIISTARYFVIQKENNRIYSVKIYRVIHGEKLRFWEVILPVIVRKKKVYMNLGPFLKGYPESAV
jgi:CRISPR/Cas system CMR-associated protein Cmr3 (group 5 of RAMP superfamily)